jgi:dTDP-4-dehydrorhamnose reductase
MNILLTGKNGQLGFELQRSLAPLGQVHAIGTADCNLADANALRALIRDLRPELIVNPAAYTAVDKAEQEPELAHAVNAVAPGVMGEEAQHLGASVIHYSTDYVFNGEGSSAYREGDATEPLGVYGQSKLAGEQSLSLATQRHVILRTSWVVGAHGNNFAKTMLRLAADRPELRVVDDQWGAPTSAALIADLTSHLVARLKAQPADYPYGLYHLAAGGETHWCDYARYVVAQAMAAGRTLQTRPESVLPIPSQAYPTPAKRPANSRLDTQRFRDTFGLTLPHWQHGVGHVLQQIL